MWGMGLLVVAVSLAPRITAELESRMLHQNLKDRRRDMKRIEFEPRYIGTVSTGRVLSEDERGGVLMAEVYVIHRYRCPLTRYGKSYGPCDCGGEALYRAWARGEASE